MQPKAIVIWAQSVCRSTMALYSEVKSHAGCPVTVIVRRSRNGEAAQYLREQQGQNVKAYLDVIDEYWDGEYEVGREILEKRSHQGAIHVFSGYQVSASVRCLISDAHALDLRVVVYDEAPCPMCLGTKAVLKRAYYRWVLPYKVHNAVESASLMLNASGAIGRDELMRLGWRCDKIIPFGYASPAETKFHDKTANVTNRPLRILHAGMETPYRDVRTLTCAVELLKGNGIEVEVERTGGKVSLETLSGLYEWADVFVACGLCEPWGMRVNDAIHAGLPVIVSSGMGTKWLVEQFGCGYVYEKGNAREFANILARFVNDGSFRASLLHGAAKAHRTWMPEERAKVFLEAISVE